MMGLNYAPMAALIHLHMQERFEPIVCAVQALMVRLICEMRHEL